MKHLSNIALQSITGESLCSNKSSGRTQSTRSQQFNTSTRSDASVVLTFHNNKMVGFASGAKDCIQFKVRLRC